MAKGKTIHFLLTYDRSERRLVNMEKFRDGKKAVDRLWRAGARVR